MQNSTNKWIILTQITDWPEYDQCLCEVGAKKEGEHSIEIGAVAYKNGSPKFNEGELITILYETEGVPFDIVIKALEDGKKRLKGK